MADGEGKNVALITGMGRSGTSVFARWMSEIGFNFGHDLGKTVNASGSVKSASEVQHVNPTGNFEDAGLMSLHVELYKKNNLRSWLDVPLDHHWQTPPNQAELFRSYMSHFVKIGSPVAVKNPLATSFLPSWEAALPGVTVLVVYRDRAASIDSVVRLRNRNQHYRRNRIAGFVNLMKYRYSSNTVQLEQRNALRAWIRCNQESLDFTSSEIPTSTPMVINAEAWMQDNGEKVFELLSRRFDHLKYVSVLSLLKEGFFTREAPSYGTFTELENKAVSVEKALFDAEVHNK